ncbi:GNAT family N-acetyltransferase [Kineococcus sp. TBRC 1896]|uniref:GNAT family N-acetyltransferase n=1 Tax=Kineococcus mangrovi TaxID=1660183 RepID=A0ABV4HZD3_9ACTN
MQVTDGQVAVELVEGIGAERAAAGIWARATAQRDRLHSVAPLEEKLSGIQQTLKADGASLHLASRGSRAIGFCILIPRGKSLEIRYLATDPEVWGSGAGWALLKHVQEHAGRTGCPRGELWVIADNARAISAYKRAGWVATDLVEVRGSAGRPERRFVRDFD